MCDGNHLCPLKKRAIRMAIGDKINNATEPSTAVDKHQHVDGLALKVVLHAPWAMSILSRFVHCPLTVVSASAMSSLDSNSLNAMKERVVL